MCVLTLYSLVGGGFCAGMGFSMGLVKRACNFVFFGLEKNNRSGRMK